MLRDWLTRAVFLRENFRGNSIITAGGILVIAAVVVGELVLSALNRYDASSASLPVTYGVPSRLQSWGSVSSVSSTTSRVKDRRAVIGDT